MRKYLVITILSALLMSCRTDCAYDTIITYNNGEKEKMTFYGETNDDKSRLYREVSLHNGCVGHLTYTGEGVYTMRRTYRCDVKKMSIDYSSIRIIKDKL
tara:strand:- start:963 stop:1262 length:300 start_codon:yes stop_codon:yes gene_type:complete